ncbi:MAG: FKBP-type peptidyl-prolyl cis-trans isomerase [Akkermansia sp.]|nr:FKBP-type peptidyl-prolyl cis-trans isomerase [Akkermansia sp.]
MSDELETKKVMSYLIGYRIGGQMLGQMLPGIQAEDLVGGELGRGLLEGLAGTPDPAALAQAQECQRRFLAMLQERADARGKANREAGVKYMEENARKEGVVTTNSGLQYEVLEAGGGETYDAAKHGEAPTAEVRYKGTLVDGTVFDQSSDTVKFNIRQVIPGFTEALTLMPVGAKWRVTIPSHLAYGANGPGKIGPHSTLVFEMELVALMR